MTFTGTITAEDYWAGGEKRALADELMTALHLDPNEVAEIRVHTDAIVVDLLDRRAGTIRTARYPWGRRGAALPPPS